ncbi:phosphopantetheine-binding protein [Amycolatopsis sp. NBC_00348]|uniref:phosphopantetheine-binding protein n=1 Tax=Amycolatopsis sp. NBC_00348 TaxID=2975956 RepID=UPI002E2562C6
MKNSSKIDMPPETKPDPIGSTVIQAWTEVLGSPPDGPETNFFDFGGHSTAAMRMITRLRARWDTEVPIRLIFEHPVLADFIAAARRLVAATSTEEPA